MINFADQLMNFIKLMLLSRTKSRRISGRRSMYLFIFCPVFLLLTNSLKAQKLLTLEEAIATALQYNYDIILSRNDSAVAALDYSYRNAVFFTKDQWNRWRYMEQE